MNSSLTHARIERAHCLAPGLFRSLGRGQRTLQKLGVSYQYRDDERVGFYGPELLGGDDLRVFQAIIAAMGPGGHVLSDRPVTDHGQELRAALHLSSDWESESTIGLGIGAYRLARESGYACGNGGAEARKVRLSIRRLASVRVHVEGAGQGGAQLISWVGSTDGNAALYIALNPRLAAVFLAGCQYARISLSEAHALNTMCGRILHQRLSAWIDGSRTGRVSIARLIEYAYGETDHSSLSAPALKKRRRSIRLALDDLKSVGWDISVIKSTVSISRGSQRQDKRRGTGDNWCDMLEELDI